MVYLQPPAESLRVYCYCKRLIDYAKPVAEEILVSASFNKTTFADDLVSNEKARIELSTLVILKNDDVASSFSAFMPLRNINLIKSG